MKETTPKALPLLPFALSVLVLFLDQITKALVEINIPQGTISASFFGDFLHIRHVRNTAIAFSMGANAPEIVRLFLFFILPILLLVGLVIFYLRANTITTPQRWFIAGIIGGGLGNLVDRFFRPEGVVDFIDVKFFGIFGWERWPTFNIADSAVVVCGIALALSIIFARKKT
jgi:signal peptidase II